MIAKILLTLAVIVVVIIVFRVIGSASGRKATPAKTKPPALEQKQPEADDLEWDEATKSYRPRRDRDSNKG